MDYMKTFEGIVKAQLERVERLKNEQDFTDYQSLERIVIGVIGVNNVLVCEDMYPVSSW